MIERQDSSRQVLRARMRELVATARVGDRLPSERELSLRWGVARMTIRSAMDALVTEGLVERRQGSGTYVVPRPFARVLGLTSFTQDMAARGLVAGSRVLEFREVAADGAVAAKLRIPIGDPVTRFTRLRFGNGDAMAVETTWMPARLVPGLGSDDLDGSLYELLARRYRIVPGAARITIEPINPDAETRRLLTIPPGQACLRLQMVDADVRGRVIMVANCVYRGDKYQLTADISGVAFATPHRQRGE
ncbi:MAG: GntR family transcriptional regulator [Chloroflexota bacterium]